MDSYPIPAHTILASLRNHPVAYKISKYALFGILARTFQSTAAFMQDRFILPSIAPLVHRIALWDKWKNERTISLNISHLLDSLITDRSKQIQGVLKKELESTKTGLLANVKEAKCFNKKELATLSPWIGALYLLETETVIEEFEQHLKNSHQAFYKDLETHGYCFWNLDPEIKADKELMYKLDQICCSFLEEKLKSNDPDLYSQKFRECAFIFHLEMAKKAPFEDSEKEDLIKVFNQLQEQYRASPSQLVESDQGPLFSHAFYERVIDQFKSDVTTPSSE